MASVGAFIVGIGAYSQEVVGRLGQLRYAVNDANDIEQYLRACWKPAELVIVRVKEDEATAAALDPASHPWRCKGRTTSAGFSCPATAG